MHDQPFDEPDLPPGEAAEAHVDPEVGAGGAATDAGDVDGGAPPEDPDRMTPGEDAEADAADEEADADGRSLLDDLDPKDPDDHETGDGALLGDLDGDDVDGDEADADADGEDADGEDADGDDADGDHDHVGAVDGPDAAAGGPDGEVTHGAPGARPTVLRRLVAPVLAAPVLAGLLAIMLIVAVFLVLGDRSTADRLEIGQCVSLREDNRIEPVGCGDGRARFRVVFIEKDTTESAASAVCARYPEATMSYFEGDHDTPGGDLVCLGNPR
jgi:hypothetical protein